MSRLRPSVSRALVVLVLACSAPSAIAADELVGARLSLRASAVAHAERLGQAPQDPAGEPAQPSAPEVPDEPRAFFKSTRGIIVLAAVAATAAYVFYSKSHDRVHSPALE